VELFALSSYRLIYRRTLVFRQKKPAIKLVKNLKCGEYTFSAFGDIMHVKNNYTRIYKK